MRYRPASRVPGRKRPSSNDDEVLMTERLAGGLGDDEIASVRVAMASATSEAPHCGQKRLLSGISSPQARHASIGLTLTQ